MISAVAGDKNFPTSWKVYLFLFPITMSNPNLGGAGGLGARKPLTLNSGFTPFVPSTFTPSAPAPEPVVPAPPEPVAEPQQGMSALQ